MPKLNRRSFLSTSAAASASMLMSCGEAEPVAGRMPNIVFIMADDLGYGELGCYGQQKIQTPNIDQVCAEGMKFNEAYAGCSVCAPSRSVLLTGLNMGHASVRSNPGGVPLIPEDITFAEALKPRGYKTGCFGKWGLGDIGTQGVPWKQGFDEFFGYLHQVHAHYYYPRFLYDNDQQFPLAGNEDGGRQTYAHDVIADQSLDFIRRNKDQPFLCYVPFTIPHLELLVPDDSMDQYRGKFEEVMEFRDEKRNHYATQTEPRTAFAGMVSRMDRDVGRIMSLLKELNLDDNTLVFFTSDNGGMFSIRDDFFNSNGGLRGNKRTFYEGGIRVPAMARWPGMIEAGATSDLPWGFWDVFPTLLDFAGIDIPPHVDGVSIAPTLLGEGKQKQREFLYWELPTYLAETGRFRYEKPEQAARWGKWKLVRPGSEAELELYNLDTDPAEATNVAAGNPDVMAVFDEYLRRARYPAREQTQPAHTWWEES
jgi:arylsulfatase A